MQMPINCPYCHGPMENEIAKDYSGVERLSKICKKRIDHSIIIESYWGDLDEIKHIGLKINDKEWAHWIIEKPLQPPSTLVVAYPQINRRTYLPYFEPDLSDCPKMIRKIKTYLLFS